MNNRVAKRGDGLLENVQRQFAKRNVHYFTNNLYRQETGECGATEFLLQCLSVVMRQQCYRNTVESC